MGKGQRLIALGAALFTLVAIIGLGMWLLSSPRPLVVTVKNYSSVDLVSVQFRMNDSTEPDYVYELGIPAGESRNIRPEIVEGSTEGSLSFTAIDSSGMHYLGLACGYTSGLRGTSQVEIQDGHISVQEECR